MHVYTYKQEYNSDQPGAVHICFMAYGLIKVGPLRTDGDFCHQGRDTEIAQIVKMVETY
jgi:hypothetical protein